ncbi:MAG: DUF2126 domain-containing protein [Bryobacteraceae bacterium]
MPIKVALNHRTSFTYDKPVSLGPQVARLRPAPHCRTPILSYVLRVSPEPESLHWQQDPNSNHLARALFSGKTQRFEVEVDLIADLSPINPFDYVLEPGAEHYPFDYPESLARSLEPYLGLEPGGSLFQRWIDRLPVDPQPTLSFLVDVNRRIRDEVAYLTRLEPGIQTPEETLLRRSGSCRDSTWLLVQVLRHLGIAGRFASGYLVQLASDAPDGNAVRKDSLDLHAWAEAYLPGAGWVGFDPTSGLLATEGHIPLACSPEPSDAAPITGTVEPSGVAFSYSMTTTRLSESDGRERPYSEEDWGAIEEVARQVDRDLERRDVRLTMGGEPTFVGIDEPDSPQWNGDAMGALKRTRAVTLIRRIQERWARGALLHFGQGKWYPGEVLPRWALSCHWRVDGIPLWNNPELIAEEERHYDHKPEDALTFINALTRRLQVDSSNVIPAYEDAFYYIWRERRLPVNVDVSDSKLLNTREREELARVFERGLGEAVGYVLPIRRRRHQGRLFWSSQLWFLRPERLLLLQGSSPVGYRLPLDSLPWVAPDDMEFEYEKDPFSDEGPLPARENMHPELFESPPENDPLPAEPVGGDGSKSLLRPALCVEVRDGRMHVFMPFVLSASDYVELLAAVEHTCVHLNQPVWIEGYPPPSDSRLRNFSVTPDPGVIEVNLPPAANWQELKSINTLVFEEAQSSRLTAQKFTYDGRQTPTGGGNHIVLGGATASESPLLRRPDLLRSMITFWQNHPSLSYLFSGAFIGPTSQFPRVDEARHDSLYELEIAFAQLPEGDCPFWLVDRLFRNLLADMTGNTHRAEFCIDKLYPPQNSGLRLGLLELRAFEMAPHVRMGLAELLLVRALVSAFWNTRYENRLVRWGTALHDQFLLPHFVQQDFEEVIRFLRRSGYAFERRWFEPHIQFRFPKLGSIAASGVALELRQALEPWHVLGEEASGNGTSRSVDSSLDRLQVKVSGLTDQYAVLCNGRPAPLHPTGIPGEAIAGIRYRAWQPPSCLHPTIPVHTPLSFEIVDRWNELSVGGCKYHVLHPKGTIHETRPANAAEAEARRAERFEGSTHAPGRVKVPDERLNPYFPMTLDLRWNPEVEKSAGTGSATSTV